MNTNNLRVEYSADNQVTEIEVNALKVNAGSKAMIITSGSGRIFPYIIKKPAVIYAVDINPAQQFLFLLKLEGIRRLKYSEFLELMGVYKKGNNGNRRKKLYVQLRNYLPNDARGYFDSNPEVIHKGLLYAGSYTGPVKR